ncbi:right-handed parallel beta-helix repeat-containing protein [Aureivirga marina]|uniref:right-handed parallel beta-helix repeat-containing protein n=1 Tax=Aureivirga marina TaxID=1182451 RepID=UPI0018CB8553|nr:right-handed parallel beta-helix repeat-containing protein [Aureivirga marina]
MMMRFFKKNNLFLFLFFLCLTNYAQTNLFVSNSGSDSNDGSINNPFKTIKYASTQASPGDFVYVRGGVYTNEDFGDADFWEGETVAFIQSNGTEGNYITFTPYEEEEVIIKFDGNYGFLIKNASYLKIIGFIFEGVADEIIQQEAEDAWGLYKDADGAIHDLKQEMGIDLNDSSIIGTTINKPATPVAIRPAKFNGRALVANKSHHIEFLENTVRNVPSAAIRVQQSDYVTVSRNIVYHNTYWTSLGVGAITVAESIVNPENDTFDGIKIKITENKVYENENRLISWSPSKSFVHFVIDEGTGIFLTRNEDTYSHGKMLIANNLSYKNGASGIVCHLTNDVIIEHNTVYDNGETNHGLAGGIGINASTNVQILNNISYAKENKWALGILAEPVQNVTFEANIIFNNSGLENVIKNTSQTTISEGWEEINPLFVDAENGDFNLQTNSSAINNGSQNSLQTTDFNGEERDENPDIGALEYISIISVEENKTNVFSVSPNPVNDYLLIKGLEFKKEEVKVFNIIGQELSELIQIKKNIIDVSKLEKGNYILKIKEQSFKILKE